MTAAIGVITSNTLASINRKDNESIWEIVVTFNIISGDTTGTATIPINGILMKVFAKLPDMASAEGTLDLTLSDNGDNTIFTASNLAESTTHPYSVTESLSDEINIALAFTDPAASVIVVVTLRGLS